MRARIVLSAVCLSVAVSLGMAGSSPVAVAVTADVQDFAAEKA